MLSRILIGYDRDLGSLAPSALVRELLEQVTGLQESPSF